MKNFLFFLLLIGQVPQITLWFFSLTFLGELMVSFLPYIIVLSLCAFFLTLIGVLAVWQQKNSLKIILYTIFLCVYGFTLFVSGYSWLDFYDKSDTIIQGERESVSFLFANIYKDNTEYEDILSLWREMKPDVVMFVEYRPHHAEGLAELVNSYEYKNLSDGSIQRGYVIFSDFPITNLDLEQEGGWRFGSVMLQGPTKPYYLFLVHTSAPNTPSSRRQRNSQLERLKPYIEAYKESTIMLGDFNISPRSPSYQTFLSGLALVNVSRQTGLFDPTRCLANTTIMCSHIDHMFASRDIAVQRTSRDLLGSDHDAFVGTFQ